MKFLTVRELRNKSAKVWKELPEENDMIVTSNGKPVAILTAIGESDVVESLQIMRRARALQAVETMQRQSLRHGTDKLIAEEIDDQIRVARKTRRK